MHRRIFCLLFLIAGVLLFQSAQAQTLVDADATSKLAPTSPPTFTQDADTATELSILLARNAGTITGTGDLTLNVTGTGTQEYKGLNAVGTGSSIEMTAGQTVIDMTGINSPPSAHYRGAFAELGGTVTLKNVIVFMGPGPGATQNVNRAIEAGDPGSKLSATDTTVNINGDLNAGAFAFHGATLSLTATSPGKSSVTVIGSNGFGIASQTRLADELGTTLSATDTVISVTGDTNDIVAAYFRGATTTVTNCTIMGSGSNNFGLDAFFGGVVNVFTSPVTSAGSSAALVRGGGVLNVVGSAIHGDVNGIEISDAPFFGIQTLGPNTVTLTNSTLTNRAGDNGEAAFKVEGAVANISVTLNSTVDSGVGATQHTLLDVTQTENRPSDVVLTADNSMLNGDILSDSASTTTVHLAHNTVLNGAINENTLTGASGIDPNEPAVNLPPQTVNLSIDGTSTWNMRASSTLNTLGSSLFSVGRLLGGFDLLSAALRLVKVESDINGILPAGGGPLPFISVLA